MIVTILKHEAKVEDKNQIFKRIKTILKHWTKVED
jgi:hypothetical protein